MNVRFEGWEGRVDDCDDGGGGVAALLGLRRRWELEDVFHVGYLWYMGSRP
jgi:hypothetical protein